MNTILERIALIELHASDIARMADTELGRRIVFTTRSRVMISVISDTLKTMDKIEREAVADDFSGEWHALRKKLANSQTQFQQIINGGAGITQPACHPATGRNR